MSVPVNINNIWREVDNPQTCINGIWRDTEQWMNINGIWRRDTPKKTFKAEDIMSFRMIYLLNKQIHHPMYPELEFNEDLENILQIHYDKEENLNTKTLLFEYSKDKYEVEGNFLFIGRLYAILSDGSSISISDINDNPMSCEFDNIAINISGYTVYESYGPYVTGWNRMFKKNDNLPQYEINSERNVSKFSSMILLPSYRRDSDFYPVAAIGIARNMSDPNHNMVGSYGLLEHTIESITVNGKHLPFKIEVYK